MALLALGMLDRLAEIADPSLDSTGIGLDREKLPKRIRERGHKDKKTVPVNQSDASQGPTVLDDDEGTAF
ncbi:hypothetical protein [Paracoccus seriniphilus]|nr:hypothetical protein [Paracoccus seriniphilus]